MSVNEAKTAILNNKTALGIEFGSTRIKAVLVDDKYNPIASGSYEWENRYENGAAVEAEKESAKSCKKAIQYIGTEHCLFDIKTHHQGTLSVSTNGIQLTAEFEIFQKHCNNENYDNCDHYCRRNVCRNKFTFFVCRDRKSVV